VYITLQTTCCGKKNNVFSDDFEFTLQELNVREWVFGAKHNVGSDTYRKFHASMMKHAYSTIYESKNGINFIFGQYEAQMKI
jgi:hypothetical protein